MEYGVAEIKRQVAGLFVKDEPVHGLAANLCLGYLGCINRSGKTELVPVVFGGYHNSLRGDEPPEDSVPILLPSSNLKNHE